MPFFNRPRPPIHVDFKQPPQESPDVRARIADIDQKLLALKLIPVRTAGTRARMDQLLDERNAIRRARPATVPVVPGRSS